ncbi:dihydrodipicolinate synthase family protein [Sulfitobacter mediterraneus]|uniref:dihydrodipicolinate synthase family protein n=1 Tax=Sulfitobacter mediterraneus TaxID=83219 RepID=UPI002490EDBA|nr:dihydrodipicolinate synthase family protein [Sulfitobacter mediterraneus]
MYFARRDAKFERLVGGIIAPTLAPFDEAGKIMCDAITDQARRLTRIEGVIGITVNTTVRERLSLTPDERLEVIRCTRKGLVNGQILVSCVGELSEAVFDDVVACKAAGADAIITFPGRWQKGLKGQTLGERITHLATLTDRLALPVILAHGNGDTHWAEAPEDLVLLASSGRQILGFDMGHDDNVLRYDQDYFALKSASRQVVLLPSSEAALFHNLNTGGDGVLSSLAYIAPHEVAALYAATRGGQIHKAQAIHDRLAPLVKLLDGHDANTREMIYREIAHARCLLASPTARGLTKSLCPHLTASLHTTLDDIALEPISWV